MPLLFFLTAVIHIKDIWNDKPLFILSLLALGASLKTFFFTDLNKYGLFTLPMIFMAFTIIFIKIINFNMSKAAREKMMIYSLSILSFVFFVFHINMRLFIGSNTLIGVNDNMYSIKMVDKALNVMVSYLKEYTNSDDRVLVYPEGEIINFLSNRKTDYMYYSLHPIFLETFGEENIIKRINHEKIEYIILVKGFAIPNFNNKRDYKEFKKFVENNYYLTFVVKTPGDEDCLYLYKLR